MGIKAGTPTRAPLSMNSLGVEICISNLYGVFILTESRDWDLGSIFFFPELSRLVGPCCFRLVLICIAFPFSLDFFAYLLRSFAKIKSIFLIFTLICIYFPCHCLYLNYLTFQIFSVSHARSFFGFTRAIIFFELTYTKAQV